MTFKITIKKTVEESYIIKYNEAGSIATKDDAVRMATLYAQVSERELSGHLSATFARVGNSQKVLRIKDLDVSLL